MASDGGVVSDRLSEALAGRLALQMSVSSLPMVEEWMDAPLSRWLDSVPLPLEMPGGEGPPLIVAVGSDAQLLRWRAGGSAAGVVPKMVEYLRRAGALPADFSKVDGIGQALEPAVVGSWIEARPGVVATGWFVADRMDLNQLRGLLGEGDWMNGLSAAGGPCLEVGRSIGDGAMTGMLVQLAGDAAGKVAAAAEVFAGYGFAFDGGPAARFGDRELAIGVRARQGAVVSVRLVVERPGPGAAVEACTGVGLELAPAVTQVERSIGAGELIQLEIERSAAGPSVVVEYMAGASRAPAN